MKIFITGQIPETAVKILKDRKFKVFVNTDEKPQTRSRLIKYGKDAYGIISLLSDKFDPAVIDGLKRCRVIANYAVGFNNIDIKYAAQKNIVVTTTPDVLTDSTADLAIALILACSRRIIEAEKLVKNGEFKGWKPKLMLGSELRNKILGILGAGRIGAATAERAKAFGMKILYYSNSRKPDLEKKTGAVKAGLGALLKKSDIISLHLPLTSETYHLLNKDNLCFLKRTAIIINTARGEIIDENELIRILRTKKIRCAGLDVYENEPRLNPGLFELDNVVMLPHIGSATEEARNKMAELAAKNVANVLSGKKALTPVN